MKHKTFVQIGMALCAQALIMSAPAQAESDFPTRTVRLVAGLGAGSSMDLVARTISPKLSEMWGQSVVVENRVGAAGNIAAEQVSREDDGHTLLVAQNAITVSASLYPNLRYDLRKDLKAVTQLTSMPHVLVVAPSLPVKTLRDFINLAKAKPGQLNFSSAGVGNADHMAAELFTTMAGITMTHIPYTGGSQAITAAAAGDVQLYFPGLPVSLPLVQADKVRALAVTSSSRSPALPDVPTVKEAGLPNYETVLWYGVYAPASMSDATVQRISDDIHKALQLPDVQEKLRGAGIDVVGSKPEQFQAFTNSEIDRWATIVHERKLKVE
ncbi:tripartite tricarboxylate transporter substrate binding protein [Bordetella sp. BOR01]|uniref:Bug family tripartite tricarboxylate transporter substrate binding protein n=1 Tax=Bordetella sp. BOR01 TaxID=2854779 RepID=UPI001C47D3C1|nr:tripartite tricarboxylate transporter substrate binding protein [Bordetella sp. BOR01]MBV7483175.1 tripartite tricarboxylate transporter substrate binding protein [Bordetella sp. BOR01]